MDVPSKKEGFSRNNKHFQDVPSNETTTAPSLSITAAQDDPYEPSKEELKSLRHTGEKIGAAAWLVAMFSGAERFAWYALQAPLRKWPSLLIISARTDPDFQKTTSKTRPKTLQGQEL